MRLLTPLTGSRKGCPLVAGEPVRPLGALSVAAQILLALTTLFLFGVELSDMVIDLDTGTDAELMAIGSLGLALALSYLASAAVFICWFRRAYGNLTSLGVSRLKRSKGWAIGAWFVPFYNLWGPKAIANDIYRGSDPLAPANAEASWRSRSVAPQLTLWWTFFIMSGFLGRATSRGDVSDVLRIIEMAVDICAGVMAIAVVRLLTARQQARAERLSLAVD